MAKRKVVVVVRIQIPAGKATPAPPVGTALGPHGINIMEFCKQYNAATAAQEGMVVPAEVTVFDDRSFTFVTKTPPTPVLIRAALGIDKGSVNPGRVVAGAITTEQLTEIAETKLPDLNCEDLDSAVRQVLGTARSMGVSTP
ncbi:MAG: 50S ribosomal protein L11 [Acidimicrobiales bacterium]